jgi:hypothetical protein
MVLPATAQRHFELGVTASRERVSFIDLSRVAALPTRSQDINIGVRAMHHLSPRLAFLGAVSYTGHRFFGRQVSVLAVDLGPEAALMQTLSLETSLGLRVKVLSQQKLQGFADVGVAQALVVHTEFPKAYVINTSPLVEELPELTPRVYNLAVGLSPGLRYKAHDYLSIDAQSIFKWYAVGNTSYRDQLALGWCLSLNYRIGK